MSCTKDSIVDPERGESKQIIAEPNSGSYYDGEAPTFSKVTVFSKDILYPGFDYFRIPALVTTNAGTLLAFSEMRTAGDLEPKTLVLRRSIDNGNTWEQLILVEELTTSKIYGNETIVVDAVSGNIHLIYLEIFTSSGGNTCNMYQRTSTDDGTSWSERKLIPNVVQAAWRPAGPGKGIQLKRGQHTGRLIIPGRYIEGSTKGNYGLYSDDGGSSWQLGYKSNITSVGIENETTCVELNKLDGNQSVVYINSRDQQSGSTSPYRRLEAYSYDSGETLENAFRHNDFIKTDICQGDLLRYSATDEGAAQNRILFSGLSWAKEVVSVSAQSRRRHLGIWSSFDETGSWTSVSKRINDLKAGYSNMALTHDNKLAILFEEGEANYFNEISLVKINEAFLDVPLIGAKWDFEELSPRHQINEGTDILDMFTGGTSRELVTVGNLNTIEGSETFNQNTALYFDGTSCLKLSDIDTWTQLDFNENSSFTIEFVMKAEKPGIPLFILGRPHSSGWPQWIVKQETDGTISFRIDDDEDFAYVKTKSPVSDNRWHHIAIVRDRATLKLKTYIDGVLSNEVVDNIKGSLANRRDFYIGGIPGKESNFKGEIDFVRISPYKINDFLK